VDVVDCVEIVPRERCVKCGRRCKVHPGERVVGGKTDVGVSKCPDGEDVLSWGVCEILDALILGVDLEIDVVVVESQWGASAEMKGVEGLIKMWCRARSVGKKVTTMRPAEKDWVWKGVGGEKGLGEKEGGRKERVVKCAYAAVAGLEDEDEGRLWRDVLDGMLIGERDDLADAYVQALRVLQM